MIESRRMMFIFGLTLITVLSWIGFGVYRIQRAPVTAPIQMQIEPLDPTLDLTVINSLKNRTRLAEAAPLVTSEPRTATSSPTPTPSPNSVPENQATVSSPIGL